MFRTGAPAVGLCLAVSACQLAGPASVGPAASDEEAVVVAPGQITGAQQSEAAALLESAEESFEARRFQEVLRVTSDIVERFPASDASGEALLLNARAELELSAPEGVDASVERYVSLVPPGDQRAATARMLQVEAWEGEPTVQLDRLLRIERFASPADLDAGVALARSATSALTPGELESVLLEAPTSGPLAPIAQVRHALDLADEGEDAAAIVLARAVLSQGDVPEPERSFAEEVVALEELQRGGERAFEIATVLPEGGPPALADFARLVAEGVEVAAATVLGDDYRVAVDARDDRGDPLLAADFVAELEDARVAGAVGFLEDLALEEAGLARTRGLPIISPTARSASSAGEGVYSLEGADLPAATSVGRYAVDRGYQRVAIVLPDSPPAEEEADAFVAEATAFGIPIVGRFRYQPGATFFESQIIGARDALRAAEIAALGLGEEDTLRVEMLEPVGIFMPIPPEDVEFVAPQIAHFALDTLAIEILGTSGWTDPQVLASLETRYTDRVVATAPVGAGPGSPGRLRFQAAYEEYFQQSLVSPTPAIGYDSALLLLEALRAGRSRPRDVLEAFRELRDVEGATGIFSVIDDRVVRRTELVEIENGSLTPVFLY